VGTPVPDCVAMQYHHPVPCTEDEPARARPGHGRTPVHHTVRTGTVTPRTDRSAPHGRTTRSPSVM
jgi:hypothetical protein